MYAGTAAEEKQQLGGEVRIVARFCNVDLTLVSGSNLNDQLIVAGHTSTSAILDISLTIVSFCSNSSPQNYQTHTTRLLIPDSYVALAGVRYE